MHAFKHIVRSTIIALVLGGPGLTAVAHGQTTIQSNTPVTGISASSGTLLNYKIWVPTSKKQLMVKVTGGSGSGDADLYIRRSAKPTFLSWDFRPFLTGSNEQVTINNPSPSTGTWYYIMIRAFTNISNVTLTAKFENVSKLAGNGGVIKNIAAQERVFRHYRIDVPAGATKLIIKTSGGTGEMDLYVNHGSPADDDRWDFRPFKWGNNETASIANPTPGTWWIMLDPYEDYTGVKLSAEFEGLPKYRMSSKGNQDTGTGMSVTDSPGTSWRYGNWGGSGWTNRREVTFKGWDGSFSAPVVDALDNIFRQHDVDMRDAGTNSTAKQQAKQNMIDGLNLLPSGASGENHPVWGQIFQSSPSGAPFTVMVKPGSPIALPQVITSPKPMPFSEYARRQALLGVDAGWFTK